MSSAETDALAKATREDGSFDEAVYQAEFKKALRKRQDHMVREAHDLWRSMDGWQGVETAEAWDAIVREATTDLATGKFFLDRMGGQKYLDPMLMAVLRIIRADLIREYEADSASDFMLIDMVIMHYQHVLSTNNWIGNIMASTQTEMFGRASLTTKLEGKYGRGTEFRGLRIEEFVRRLTEQLMPMIEKSNGLLLRNLSILQERKEARRSKRLRNGPDQSIEGVQPMDDGVDRGSDQGPVPIRRSRRRR